MLDAKTIRKLLMTAVVAALATTPVAAESPAQNCDEVEQHYGLFCNDDSDIEVCRYDDGCTVNCGLAEVEADC